MVHRRRVLQRRWKSRKPAILWIYVTTFDGAIQYFYNDVFRYSPEKVRNTRSSEEYTTCKSLQDEWRKFVSQTCPGPRSAHAVVASPAGGGKLFLFGVLSSAHSSAAFDLIKSRGRVLVLVSEYFSPLS